MTVHEAVIIGGGIAGLCAARRLLELGIKPTVIEAGSYPAHKVCGEFLSPSALPILNGWDIHPIPIRRMEFFAGRTKMSMELPQPAGSLSHLTLDLQLAEQISHKGGEILTFTKVTEIHSAEESHELHVLRLSSGAEIKTKRLIIATGRLFNSKTQKFIYTGYKAHFSDVELHSTLFMFSFPYAYLGVSPIEKGKVNVACIAKSKESSKQIMEKLVSSHPLLKDMLKSSKMDPEHWLEVRIPEFGIKPNPNWPQTYWIGDAFGTIPPISGNGLTLAIMSGCLAAEYAKKGEWQDFKKDWNKGSLSKIQIAKILHRLFLSPTFGCFSLQVGNYIPFLKNVIYQLTR